MKFVRAILLWPLRSVPRFVKTLVALTLLLSLGLNIAMLTINGFYSAVAATVGTAGIAATAAQEVGEHLKTRRQATQQMARETSERVTKRAQRNAARNIASSTAEAIPVVGVAVIAAALVLEVQDACDTARDMAGLEAALATAEGADMQAAREAAENEFDCASLIPTYDDLPNRGDLWRGVMSAPQNAWQAASVQYDSLAAKDWSSAIDAARTDAIEWLRATFSFDSLRQLWGGETPKQP